MRILKFPRKRGSYSIVMSAMGKGVGRHNIHAEVGGADTKQHSRI